MAYTEVQLELGYQFEAINMQVYEYDGAYGTPIYISDYNGLLGILNPTFGTRDSILGQTLYSKDGYSLTVDNEGRFTFINPQNESANYQLGRYNQGTTYFTIGFAIDDENQIGTFVLYGTNYNYAARWSGGSNTTRLLNSNWIYNWIKQAMPLVSVTATGGGATHIAKVTGHLSALSNNLSDILIVAGGGGGGMIIDSVAYDGADAGGISGSGTNSANQTTGYAFGQGESGSGVSGGGGGLYGGYKGVS